jgi:hypothetical protein
LKTLYRATTSIQRPLFCGPKGGRCRQVWLYLLIERQIKHKNRSTRFSHNSAPSFTQNPKDPPLEFQRMCIYGLSVVQTFRMETLSLLTLLTNFYNYLKKCCLFTYLIGK